MNDKKRKCDDLKGLDKSKKRNKRSASQEVLAIIDKVDTPLTEVTFLGIQTNTEIAPEIEIEKTTPEINQLEQSLKITSPSSLSPVSLTTKINSHNTQNEKTVSSPPPPTITTPATTETKMDTEVHNNEPKLNLNEKNKNIAQEFQDAQTALTDAIETKKNDDKDMLILVDFELTYTNKKLKKSLIRSQLELELDQLSEILPIIAYKLTNINLSEYTDDFEKRSHLLDFYSAFINKLETQTKCDQEFKRKLFTLELNVSEIDSTAKQTELIQDLEQKLNLIQRIQNECMQRLNLQKNYLNELKQLFDKLNTDISNYAIKTKTNITGIISSLSPSDDKKFYCYIMQKLKKAIFQLQSSLVEYARFNKQNERFNLVNGLPFNCLFEVMDRFMKAYDIK